MFASNELIISSWQQIVAIYQYFIHVFFPSLRIAHCQVQVTCIHFVGGTLKSERSRPLPQPKMYQSQEWMRTHVYNDSEAWFIQQSRLAFWATMKWDNKKRRLSWYRFVVLALKNLVTILFCMNWSSLVQMWKICLFNLFKLWQAAKKGKGEIRQKTQETKSFCLFVFIVFICFGIYSLLQGIKFVYTVW